MKIEKYDASGNNFIIFHTNKREDYSDLAIKLTKQYNTDGLIVVVPHMVYDFEWLFYNNDGSTANMCGNGTRAVAHYAYNNKISGSFMKFLTGAGEIDCKVEGDIVETTMPKAKEIKKPFFQNNLEWWLVDTGVPHLVTIVDDLDSFDIELCSKMRYQYDANVNYASIKDGKVYVRTYERGVEDETLACGTGMTACFLRALNLGLIDSSVEVFPKSKEKLVLRKENGLLFFKGKVKKELEEEI
ncbi:MAG: diaminopimelate epimerase [Campylobacterota bacterium]|nr:diaminopimelate epimerase [Campylobacterota bacterium]